MTTTTTMLMVMTMMMMIIIMIIQFNSVLFIMVLNQQPGGHWQKQLNIQGGSNVTGTDLCVNKPHCAAAVRP